MAVKEAERMTPRLLASVWRSTKVLFGCEGSLL